MTHPHPVALAPRSPRRRDQQRTLLVVDDFGTAVAHVRRCSQCLTWKPLNEQHWPRNPNGSLGFPSECRSCKTTWRRALDGQRCVRCDGPKPAGRGRRLCDDCEPASPARRCSPCPKCGERTPKRRGQHLCDDCNETEKWRTRTRAVAQRTIRRQPCARCGRPKGPGKRKWCDSCRAEARAAKTCRDCPNPVRGPRARLCDECKAAALERQKAWRSDYQRRRYAADPEIYRRYHREAKRRRTVEQRARENESRRIRYRLRAEQDGRAVNERRAVRTRAARELLNHRVSLPGPQLAAVIRNEAARRDLPMEELCETLGVTDRAVRRWEAGDSAGIPSVDRILTALDLTWWEVWTPEHEDAHAAAAAVFERDIRSAA